MKLQKTFIFVLFLAIPLLVLAQDSVVINISCVIPPVAQLSEAQDDSLPNDVLVQYEQRIRDGKKVILKTVVSK